MDPLCLFHAHISVVTRSKRGSAAKALAYCTGAYLRDCWTGTRHDYRHRKDVIGWALVNFSGSLEEMALALDSVERRRDSQVGRLANVAFPDGLTDETLWGGIYELGHAAAEYWNVPALIAQHAPPAGGHGANVHAHYVFGTRAIPLGRNSTKCAAFATLQCGRDSIRWFRRTASAIITRQLESVGRSSESLLWDDRSYVSRGILRVPGKHRGLVHTRIRRSVESQIEELDRELLAVRIEALQEELSRGTASHPSPGKDQPSVF